MVCKSYDVTVPEVVAFILLVFTTLIVAGAGYVVNDIRDHEHDTVNKPEKSYIPHQISLSKAKHYYIILLSIGLMTISGNILLSDSSFYPIIYYIMANTMLLLYAIRYKNSILIGNIIVSTFVALVPAVIVYTEWSRFDMLGFTGGGFEVVEVLMGYMVFSFVINMVREIVKDIEDIAGDSAFGLVTLPIKYGIDLAKKLCIGLIILAIILMMGWMLLSSIEVGFRINMFLILLIICPLTIVIQIITKTTQKRDFTKVSGILKWIMLGGLVSLVMITNHIL
ncbi:MAG: UbiA family prenyltransferase [Saprospiraceae bacterium]